MKLIALVLFVLSGHLCSAQDSDGSQLPGAVGSETGGLGDIEIPDSAGDSGGNQVPGAAGSEAGGFGELGTSGGSGGDIEVPSPPDGGDLEGGELGTSSGSGGDLGTSSGGSSSDIEAEQGPGSGCCRSIQPNQASQCQGIRSADICEMKRSCSWDCVETSPPTQGPSDPCNCKGPGRCGNIFVESVCDGKNSQGCFWECDTPPPTEAPTEEPTVEPTRERTRSPTVGPTNPPPTVRRTRRPTAEVTEEPIEPLQPNVIFILLDDWGWKDVGFNGAEFSTPNLDEVANSGIRFDNYYTHFVCTPTRAALFTGRQALEVGTENMVFFVLQDTDLDHEMVLSEKIQESGYATHMFGKWHLGYARWDSTPTYRGFDTYLGNFGSDITHFTHETIASHPFLLPQCLRDNGNYSDYTTLTDAGYDFQQNSAADPESNVGVGYEYEGQYTANIYTEKTLELLDGYAVEQTKPFYIYLSHNIPHSPFEAPYEDLDDECFAAPYEDRMYLCGMIKNLDRGVGQIVDKLKDTGLWDNTFLIISSDHGADINSDGGSNAPFRNGKASFFEGGQKAIAFATGPGIEPRVTTELMFVSDWYLTISGMIGLPDTPDIKYDRTTAQLVTSYNLWPGIEDENADWPREIIVYNIEWDFDLDTPKDKGAIRNKDYKLIRGANVRPRDGWYDASLDNATELICNSRDECLEAIPENLFFKISEDPEERNDLGTPSINDTDTEAYEQYNILMGLFSAWMGVVVEPVTNFDLIQYAQGVPELWDCHFHPWISSDDNPIAIDSAHDCASYTRDALPCRLYSLEAWKCPAGVPDANVTNCPEQAQPTVCCPCEGDVTTLDLLYLGEANVTVRAEGDGNVLFEGDVVFEEEFTVFTSGTYEEVIVFVDGNQEEVIPTDCDPEINIGSEFGDFVISLAKTVQELCRADESPSDECV